METKQELVSAVKNIRYYVEKIQAMSKKQFDLYFEYGTKHDIDIGPGSKIFDCLGCIQNNVGWMFTYCNNIESNIKHVLEQEKELNIKEADETEQG